MYRTSTLILLALLTGCYSGASIDADAVADTDGDLPGESQGGDSGGSGGDEPEVDEPEQLACDEVGFGELRMVTSQQYHATLKSLLPEPLASQALEVSTFPETTISSNFSTFATANRVNTDDSMRIEDTAEAIAELVLADFETHAPALSPCLEAGTDAATIDGCVHEFIETFGARAFRRPLTNGEAEVGAGIYETLRESDSAQVGFAGVLQFFLQAPALLYLTEAGAPVEGFDLRRLSGAEVATRLAYLLTDRAPDEALLEAAERGDLDTADGIEAQARRLMEAPEFGDAVATFHHEWMRGFDLDGAEHPLYDETLEEPLHAELRTFARWFLENTDGSFQSLMTSTAFEPDAALDVIYQGDTAGPRKGLMMTAAALSALSNTEGTTLIRRGVFIREHVLCLDTGSLPADVDTAPLDDTSDRPTARERLEPLMTNPTCAGCHATFNPLGFPLETYDGLGAFRTEENGVEIDASADLRGVLGPDATVVASTQELIDSLASSELAHDCYAKHWFRYAMGRLEDPQGADDCALQQIQGAFADTGGDMRELLVALVRSEAFRFRPAAP